MDALTLQTIADFAGGTLRRENPAQVIRGISSDTRDLGVGNLFLALRGEHMDGHKFLDAAVAKGAAGAIVSEQIVRDALPDGFALIRVDDTLAAYQRIAACYRQSLPLKLVAITGSNGKTSTKDLTAAVLGSRHRVLKTSGNFNNHLGVPVTLLRASAADEFAVLELGMNHPGEIEPLARMAAPGIGVITNIGTAHLEFMRTREAIAQEKGMLAEAIDRSGYVILPAEDVFTKSISERTAAKVLTVGFSQGDIRAQDVRQSQGGSKFTVVTGQERVEAYLPVPGKHMVLNSLLAIAVGQVSGLSLGECAAALAQVNLTKGRLEFKEVQGLQFLDDTYNANPDSMVAALETLAQLPVAGRRIAVLGRMGELGSESEAGHRRVGDAAAAARIDQVIAVGAEAEFIAENARKNGLASALSMGSVEEAARWINESVQPEDLVLLKGSRSAGMERILNLLTDRHSQPERLINL